MRSNWRWRWNWQWWQRRIGTSREDEDDERPQEENRRERWEILAPNIIARILRAGGGVVYYIKFVRYYNGIQRLGPLACPGMPKNQILSFEFDHAGSLSSSCCSSSPTSSSASACGGSGNTSSPSRTWSKEEGA